MLLDKSLHMWLVWTLPLNSVANNVFSCMWSDLSSDMHPSVKVLLSVIFCYLFDMHRSALSSMKRRWSCHLQYSGVVRRFVEYVWKWFGKRTQKKKHDLVYCQTVVIPSACHAFDAGELHRSLTRILSGLSLIHIWRCRRSYACRSRWSPYH